MFKSKRETMSVTVDTIKADLQLIAFDEAVEGVDKNTYVGHTTYLIEVIEQLTAIERDTKMGRRPDDSKEILATNYVEFKRQMDAMRRFV